MTESAPAESAEIRHRREQNYRRSHELRIRTAEDAAEFVVSVGFAVPYPQAGVELPSLWEAHVGHPGAPKGWGADVETVWRWKDELPANRRAFYGAYFRTRPSLVSLEMLPNLLALLDSHDAQERYDLGELSHNALRIYETLSQHGPLPRRALRAAAGMTASEGNARFQRGVRELEGSLLVARVGVAQEGPSGWPSTVYDLMSDAFPKQWEQPRRIRHEDARMSLLSRYLATVVAADESGMARLFGWPIGEIRDTFAQLGPSVREAEGTGWWMWEQ